MHSTWPQYAFISAFAVAVGAYLVSTMFRRRPEAHQDIGKWMISLIMFTGAAGFGLRVPGLDVAVDRAVGIPNFSALLGAICYMLCGGFLNLWIAFWRDSKPDDVWLDRRRAPATITYTVGVCAILTVLFFAGQHRAEFPGDFSSRFLDAPSVAFTVIFLAGFSVYFPLAVLACQRVLAETEQTSEWDAQMRRVHGGEQQWMRYGMRLVANAMCLGFVYGLIEIALWLTTLGHMTTATDWLATIANVIAVLATSSTTLGATCGLWGPGLSARRAPVRAARAEAAELAFYDALNPLWQRIAGQVCSNPAPEGLLSVSASAAAAYLPIQFADARPELSPYADARIAQAARRAARRLGCSPAQATAVVEVAVWIGAADAKSRSARPVAPRPLRLLDPRTARPYLVAVASASVLVNPDGSVKAGRSRSRCLLRRAVARWVPGLRLPVLPLPDRLLPPMPQTSTIAEEMVS